MSLMSSLRSITHAIESAVEVVCKAVLTISGFSLLAVLVTNVFMRYVLEGSLDAASELPSLLFPWFVMGAIVLAAVRGNHIAMSLTMHMLPPGGRRFLAGLIYGLSAVVFTFLGWFAVDNMLIAHDEVSTILHVPGSVGYAALTIAYFLLALTAVSAMIRYVICAEPIIVDLTSSEGSPT